MDNTWLLERYNALKTQIEAYETAIGAIVTRGAQSYTLNTGQTTQTVTKLNVASLQRDLDYMYVRLETMHKRLYGGQVIARPGY